MIKLAKIWLSIWVKNQFIWVNNSEQILRLATRGLHHKRGKRRFISERFVDFEPRILLYLLREICAKIPASWSNVQIPSIVSGVIVFLAYAGPTNNSEFSLSVRGCYI